MVIMNVISLGLVALILLPLCASAAELDGLYFMTRFRPGATGKLETATYRFHDGEVARDPIGIVEGNDIAAERVSRPGGQMCATRFRSNSISQSLASML